MAQHDSPYHKVGKCSSLWHLLILISFTLWIDTFLLLFSCSLNPLLLFLFSPPLAFRGSFWGWFNNAWHKKPELSKKRGRKGNSISFFPSFWLPWAFSPFSHLLQAIYSVTSQTDNVQANGGQNITNKNTMT